MAGSRKGIPNKRTEEIQVKLARLKCDPFEGMAKIANNELPCGVCRGKLKTKYKLGDGMHAAECRLNKPEANGAWACSCEGMGIRTCQSCWGDGFEACSPDLRAKMYAELAGYVAPKRKAIELSGEVGMPDLAAILRARFERRNGEKS